MSGCGQDSKTFFPEGLKRFALNEKQCAMLVGLVEKRTGIIHDRAAVTRMAEVKSGLNESRFAWSGPKTVHQLRTVPIRDRLFSGSNSLISRVYSLASRRSSAARECAVFLLVLFATLLRSLSKPCVS